MEERKFKVSEDFQPIRLDRYLSNNMPDVSRNRIQKIIESGQVYCNNKIITKISHKVSPGAVYHLTIPEPVQSSIEPENIPINIIYEDSDLVVINKSAGISVHPTEHIKSGTLVNALLYHIQDLSGIGGVLRPGIIHRLDKVTSGVIVIAKNDEVHRDISLQFKQRKTQKVYLAIVHSSPKKEQGEINQPIARHPTDRKKMAIVDGGRMALTRYKIKQKGLGGSLLELYPVTGRTHQIRVHLKHLGCPIIGDTIYTTRKYSRKGRLERMLENYPGIALHAKSLSFIHPKRQERLIFEAPMPEQLAYLVEDMK